MIRRGLDDVVVLYAAIDQDFAPPAPQSIAGLTPEECDRLNRFRNVGDRARFLAGRALLGYGLRLLFDIKRGELVAGPYGKPRLAGPADADIDFNLSHSGRLVACAFARGIIVGLDVETSDGDAGMVAAACPLLATGERAHLMRLPPPQQREAFFRLWTLKEAAVKATGLGLQLPLDSFVVALDPTRLIVAGHGMGDISDWQFDETSVGDIKIATAVRHPRAVTVAYENVPLGMLYANAVV